MILRRSKLLPLLPFRLKLSCVYLMTRSGLLGILLEEFRIVERILFTSILLFMLILRNEQARVWIWPHYLENYIFYLRPKSIAFEPAGRLEQLKVQIVRLWGAFTALDVAPNWDILADIRRTGKWVRVQRSGWMLKCGRVQVIALPLYEIGAIVLLLHILLLIQWVSMKLNFVHSNWLLSGSL